MILHNRAITVNENDGLPLPKRYWAILATASGVGMSVIDGTIANVALPTALATMIMAPLAGQPDKYGYRMAPVYLRSRLWIISNTQQQHTNLFVSGLYLCHHCSHCK